MNKDKQKFEDVILADADKWPSIGTKDALEMLDLPIEPKYFPAANKYLCALSIISTLMDPVNTEYETGSIE